MTIYTGNFPPEDLGSYTRSVVTDEGQSSKEWYSILDNGLKSKDRDQVNEALDHLREHATTLDLSKLINSKKATLLCECLGTFDRVDTLLLKKCSGSFKQLNTLMKAFPNLKSLNLELFHFCDEKHKHTKTKHIEEFTQLARNLEKFYFHGTSRPDNWPFAQFTGEFVLKILKDNHNLRVFDFMPAKETYQGSDRSLLVYYDVFEELCHNKTITDLTLGSLSPCSYPCLQIFDFIKTNQTVRKFWIPNFRWESEYPPLLREALKENNTIESLSLCGNPFNPKHAPILAAIIEENPNITDLSLRKIFHHTWRKHKTETRDEAARIIVEAVKKSSLKWFSLADNLLSPECIDWIRDELRDHPTLVDLKLTKEDYP